MKQYKRVKVGSLCLWYSAWLFFIVLAGPAHAGFSVTGTQLLDGSGQPFVMRGINHGYAWFPDESDAIKNIAQAGANTVRLVLSSGAQWKRSTPRDVEKIIKTCKFNKIICILEVHDSTGFGDEHAPNAVHLKSATDYWLSIADVLKGQESYVLINIANEPFGNGVAGDTWIQAHRVAIKRLRRAGLAHTLIVDAPNWGQDTNEVMLLHALDVAAADTLKNTLFSVHMYQVYQNYKKINRYVTRFLKEQKLPLIVGEFGASHQGELVDAISILRVATEKRIGYLGWSWSGNSDCCKDLDIVKGFNPKGLSLWGDLLINDIHGIKATSRRATVFVPSESEVKK